MVLGPELAAREYEALREELLGWLRHRVLMGFTIATLTAGFYVFAGQQTDSHVSAAAMLLPQALVAWAYAFLRRNTQLTTRLACYLAVFHELPKGGGWELFSRYPFKNTSMRGPHRTFRWLHASLYTTQGLLLIILLSSALLLLLTKPFVPWGLIGILLPLVILGYHILRTQQALGYQAICLEHWHELKRELDNREVEAVFSDVVASLRRKDN